ncbi:hypothetical protein [Achromobacter aloeverae]
MINRPNLVVLDTSHLSKLANDWDSDNPGRRDTARAFIPNLIKQGWLPLLCWHQVEELLQHENDLVVDARVRYVRSWPMLAWIRALGEGRAPGSVLDVFGAEMLAAYSQPDADVLKVRALTRDALFQFGSGEEAMPEGFFDWRILRSALIDRQESARRVAAISTWQATDIDQTRIGDWLAKPLRSAGEVGPILRGLRDKLAIEIKEHGDKRITAPDAMADEFFSEIGRSGLALATREELPPALQILMNAGLSLEDIDPMATFGETMRRLVFQNQLQIAARATDLPWEELKKTVTQARLPAAVIAASMRTHAQAQPERKGSELNDTNLLCLAPYADITYVDKRTLENVRRAREKVSVFSQLVGRVEKASTYEQIAIALATTVV